MGTDFGHYSYHCDNCGYTFISDIKAEVSYARKKHKIVEMRGLMKFKFCPLVPTNKEQTMFARPDLVSRFPKLFTQQA